MAENTPQNATGMPAEQSRSNTKNHVWLFIFVIAVLLAVITLAGQLRQQNVTDHGLVNWRVSYNAAVLEAADNDKPILLVFGAQWCGPCKQMKAFVYSDQKVADAIEAGFVPFYADLTDEQGPSVELAQRYGVSNIPSLLVLDAEGNPIAGTVGYMNKAELQMWLNSAEQRYNTPAVTTAG